MGRRAVRAIGVRSRTGPAPRARRDNEVVRAPVLRRLRRRPPPRCGPAVTSLRGRWLERPWGRMRVWEAGRGEPILLVHGLGGSGRYFERLAARLDGRFRVVAPDLAGFGSSEKPKLGYERGAHLEDLDAVAEWFGDRAPIVAGHSLGGLFAALWASRRPEAVRSLAIVAAPFPSPDEQVVWTHEPEVPAAARVTVPLAAAAVRLLAVPIGVARRYPPAVAFDYTPADGAQPQPHDALGFVRPVGRGGPRGRAGAGGQVPDPARARARRPHGEPGCARTVARAAARRRAPASRGRPPGCSCTTGSGRWPAGSTTWPGRLGHRTTRPRSAPSRVRTWPSRSSGPSAPARRRRARPSRGSSSGSCSARS